MTVKELYNYAVSNSLLDQQVNVVIELFNKNNIPKDVKTQQINMSDNDRLHKIEWSTEDVLWLFSL